MKRSRPKILLATNLDDAMYMYEKYKSNLLGVISDVGFCAHRGESPEMEKLDAGLDLVKIAPTAKPPVCKIVDYGKYRYEQARREKEAKKKQKTTQVKEIRLSTFIEDHDIMVKAKTGAKFLKDGDKLTPVYKATVNP